MSTLVRAAVAALLLAALPAVAAEGGAAAAPSAPPAPPARVKEPLSGIELVHVKGGCYRMGDLFSDGKGIEYVTGMDAEIPVHEVCVGDFYLGRTEVTWGQWNAVMGTAVWERWRKEDLARDDCYELDCPVSFATQAEVEEFLRRVNAREGATRYRLPTEAEWEYAARSGGKNERYSGGNDVESVAWNKSTHHRVDGDGTSVAHPVAQKAPNGLGLYDMSGNIWERTADRWDPRYYDKSPRDNPTGPATGDDFVKRGGCGDGPPENSRTARRGLVGPGVDFVGFRLLRVP